MITKTAGWKWFGIGIVIGLAMLFASMSFASLAYAEGEETTPPPAESTPPSDPTPPPSDPAPSSDPAPAAETQPSGTEEVSGSETPDPEEDVETAPSGDVNIGTGDAISGAGAGNDVNTNEITTPGAASSTVANDNDATLQNQASSTSATGSNTGATGGGDVQIDTGNALASANVINVVNTNIINSSGILAFFNFLFGGGFDFRGFDLSYFFGGGSAQGSCSFSSCDNKDTSLTVTNSNDATVTNTVLVRGSTGGNTASTNGDGSASITTGNAYASANVFNLINTNFINSSYLLVSFNSFGDMAGDITLPGADFFTQLLAHNGMLSGQTTIANNNTATVNNNTSATADTGSNNATSTEQGDATITTGDANSLASTYNQVNTNLIGGTRVFMLINIVGDWSGTVQGLPEGMTWAHTPTGIVLMGGGGGSSQGGVDSLLADNTNNATVNNDVQVWALTGSNQATAGSGGADISTGDAYASANVVNMVNTNVIGQNWIFAIFNIFGNWNGNFSFGRPDLWIGGVAETGNPTLPGSDVTYKFTVSNNGDADAHNVLLKTLFPKQLLAFEGSETQFNPEGNVWNVGTLLKGETKEFTYIARAAMIPPGTSAAAPLEANVTSEETDNNPDDNTETLSIIISDPTPPVVGTQGPGPYTPDPQITMTKTVSVDTATLPASVDYKVVIFNEGGAAYNTILTDKLTDTHGEVIYTRQWKLGTIAPNDEITLTYSINYDLGIEPGVYTNTARLVGQRNNPVSVHATDMQPVEVSADVELLPGTQVLGAQSEASSLPLQCAAFITSYIKPGSVGNDESQVRRLQFFLRDFENVHITPNGVYDEATIAGVKAFQEKYADEILSPWGEGSPSGFVYYTTQKKINELYCQGISEFPLSLDQANHILSYRNAVGVPSYTSDETKDFFSENNNHWKTFFSPFTTLPPLLPPPSTPLITEVKDGQGFFSILELFFKTISYQLGVPLAKASTL